MEESIGRKVVHKEADSIIEQESLKSLPHQYGSSTGKVLFAPSPSESRLNIEQH